MLFYEQKNFIGPDGNRYAGLYGVNITVPFTWSLDEAGNKLTITAKNETNVVSLLTLSQNVFSEMYGTGKDRACLYATR